MEPTYSPCLRDEEDGCVILSFYPEESPLDEGLCVWFTCWASVEAVAVPEGGLERIGIKRCSFQ